MDIVRCDIYHSDAALEVTPEGTRISQNGHFNLRNFSPVDCSSARSGFAATPAASYAAFVIPNA
ncbi:hypothetical protein RvY_11177 [Ramazzottius varieornatus]|uniref:Uncharacterized protein n=1 Tax=Ramazzottius varieornatus TaxID=947166 RepID=A0A1D1VP55_RAMVA|nr:hypothetical protein RvY_11177 [Ramazzottius varieornatus]